MARTMTTFGLILLAAFFLSLSGCTTKTPTTHPTAETLAAEQKAFDMVNAQRTAAGLSALVMDETLRAVARAHSEDMVNRAYFDHVNPDGKDSFQRMDAAGLNYMSAGENIAWNNTATPAETAVAGWLASPHHLANIMRAQFNHTGMGAATDGHGAYYFTQDFIGTDAKSGGEAVFDYGEPLAIAEN